MLRFSRDTFLLRTSSGFSAWPWSSLTAWPYGRRTTWRRRRAFFRQKKNQHLNKQPPCLGGNGKENHPLWNIYICIAMIPLLSTCKTASATERRSLPEHFHHVEAASIAFCMRCGAYVWLTTLQKRTRSCVCMACVDAPRFPCGFCNPPPPILMLSYTLAKITAFSKSRAGLPPGFSASDCFMCALFYSVYLDLSPCFYLKFFISS